MPQTGKDTKVYHGGYEFTSYLDSVEASRQIAALETTTFGDASRTFVKGIKDGTASVSGFYDDTYADALETNYGGANVPVSFVFGSTAGSTALIFNAIEANLAATGSVTELVRLDAEYKPSSNGVEEGVLVLPSTTTSGAVGPSEGATYDRGTGSSSGVYMALHVISAESSGTLDVVLQTNTASDFSGTAQNYSFTQVTTSVTAEYVESTTAPKRYARVQYTAAGASSGYTFIVTYGHRR